MAQMCRAIAGAECGPLGSLALRRLNGYCLGMPNPALVLALTQAIGLSLSLSLSLTLTLTTHLSPSPSPSP